MKKSQYIAPLTTFRAFRENPAVEEERIRALNEEAEKPFFDDDAAVALKILSYSDYEAFISGEDQADRYMNNLSFLNPHTELSGIGFIRYSIKNGCTTPELQALLQKNGEDIDLQIDFFTVANDMGITLDAEYISGLNVEEKNRLFFPIFQVLLTKYSIKDLVE